MELFIKRFIDFLDELIPVSMVHVVVEQPLGAIINDTYIRIHARLDLIDEDSPFIELEIYPYEKNMLEFLYAYTFPHKGIKISEDEFKKRIDSYPKAKGEKVIPLNDENNYYYEIYYNEQIEIPNNRSEIDNKINPIINKIKGLLLIGGYNLEEEDLDE